MPFLILGVYRNNSLKMIRFLIGALYLLSTSLLSGQTIEHIEPPFWWTGMKDSTLQIMLYHTQISEYEVIIPDTRAKLVGASTPGNPNYLFLDLIIKPDCKTGQLPIKLTHKSKPELTILYELLDRAPDSANRKGFDNADAIYLITPDRFVNGDVSNDNLADNQDKI